MRLFLGVGRKGVDHFAGLGVVEFFASLVLDGVGIRLESIDVLAEAGVFLLEVLNLVFELLFLVTLLIPGGETVLTVHDAPCESEREKDGENRSGWTPALLQPKNSSLRQWKRLFGRFLFFTEQIGLLHLASGESCRG